MKPTHNSKEDGGKDTELRRCTEQGRAEQGGYPKLRRLWEASQIPTDAPPLSSFLSSAQPHSPKRPPSSGRVCFREQGLQSFRGRLGNEWPHYEPRRLELALC